MTPLKSLLIIASRKDCTSGVRKTDEYQCGSCLSSRYLQRGELIVCARLFTEEKLHAHDIDGRFPCPQNVHESPCMPSRHIVVATPAKAKARKLISPRRFDVTSIHRTHPWIARTGVSTRFERNRSLSSAVSEVSKMARKAGSMKCPNLPSSQILSGIA